MKVAAAALLAIVAMLAAGCGKDSSEDATTKWANDVCSAITTYRDSLKEAASSFSDNVTQAGFEDAKNEVKSATDTFVEDTKNLGKPDTDSGEQAKESVDTLVSQLRADLATVEQASETGLVQTLTAVSTAATTAQAQVKSTLNELESLDAQGELSDAFKQASACDSLR